jgi:hypothetical protein
MATCEVRDIARPALGDRIPAGHEHLDGSGVFWQRIAPVHEQSGGSSPGALRIFQLRDPGEPHGSPSRSRFTGERTEVGHPVGRIAPHHQENAGRAIRTGVRPAPARLHSGRLHAGSKEGLQARR